MTQANFKFVSDAIGGDQFTVVSFTGREAVSELYRYEIEVKAPLSADIDLDDVLDGLVHFVTEQNGVEFPVNGILSSFEEFKTVQNYAHYKAILVPSIWKLSNYKTNEIFYLAGEEGDIDAGLTITDIITQVLEKSGMSSDNFDLGGLSSKLLNREYTCQYGESDFDFISRLLENEGVFYYFEQSATEEKIVFVNDLNYLSLPRPRLIFDVAAMASNQDDGVFGWSCRKQRLAERVVVRNYNPEEPSLDVSETTAIDSMGQGTEYIYGQNVQTDSEATYLSQIRAEEQICRKTQFFGESSVSRLQAGYLFMLDQHPNTKYNAIEYLAIEVNHEGHNLDMSIAHDANKNTRPQYQNSFVAISADVQYRPPLKTIKPRITGNLHARIDGELLSEYAQLDSEGRYKVSMPFDFHNDDHPEGLASARVRMMQPYAGKGRGMQFPMAKGTEVLLTFVDGDPDRPLIAGAINTAAAPGPVSASNQTESVIQTGGANKIRMEDKFGSERVMLESPAANSWIRVGATNDPIVLRGASPLHIDVGGIFTDPGAGATDSSGAIPVVTDILAHEIKTLSGEIVTALDTSTTGEFILTYTENTNTQNTVTRRVLVRDPEDNNLSGTPNDGIRIRSSGNLWFEGKSKYADYHLAPSAYEGVSLTRHEGNSVGDLYDKFAGSTPEYAPTGMKDMAGVPQLSFKTHTLPKAHLRVSSLDTITTQEGNIYDFGGYWNYNLGNSYAEDHLNQKAGLNASYAYDILNEGGPSFTGWRTLMGIGNSTSPISKNVNLPAHPDSKNWTNIWVQKTFGDAYEYNEGSSISVSKGSSQEIQIGGVHVDEAYRDNGSKISWSIRGVSGAPSEEKKWNGLGTLVYHSTAVVTDASVTETETKFDRGNGAMYSYSGSSGTGMTYSGFDFNFSNGATASIDAGFRSESGLYLLGKNTNSLFLGIKFDIDLALAGALKIENDGITFSAPGFTSKTKTTVVDTNAVNIKALASKVNNQMNEINNNISSIENNVADIESAVIHLLS